MLAVPSTNKRRTAGIRFPQMLDGRLRRGVKLVRGRRDADLAQAGQVILCALGRVVRQERVPDAQLPQQSQKRQGGFEQRAAAVNRAIHVQRHMANVFSRLFINYRQSKEPCLAVSSPVARIIGR